MCRIGFAAQRSGNSTTSRRSALVYFVALSFASACHAVAQASRGARSECIAIDSGRVAVELPRGERVFVEPEVVAAAGERVLVAGTPTYLWSSPESGAALIARDTILGVVVDTRGNGAIVPAPIAARTVHAVRAAAVDANTWGVFFVEAAPTIRVQDDPYVTGMWFGLTDGVRWFQVTKLPEVNGAIEISKISSLVRTDDGFAIATVARTDAGVRVLVFIQHERRWSVSSIPVRGADYVAIASDTKGLMLATVYPDADRPADANSLWLRHRSWIDTTWSDATLAVLGGGAPVHHPQLQINGATLFATWFVRLAGRNEARVGVARDGSITSSWTLERQIDQVEAVGSDDRPIWAMKTESGGSIRSVSLWTFARDRPFKLATVPDPFNGVVGAARLGTTILIVGPIRGEKPQPIVSLYLQRFTVHCN